MMYYLFTLVEQVYSEETLTVVCVELSGNTDAYDKLCNVKLGDNRRPHLPDCAWIVLTVKFRLSIDDFGCHTSH